MALAKAYAIGEGYSEKFLKQSRNPAISHPSGMIWRGFRL